MRTHFTAKQFVIFFLLIGGSFAAEARPADFSKDAPAFVAKVSSAATDNLNPTATSGTPALALIVNSHGELLYMGDGIWSHFDYDFSLARWWVSDTNAAEQDVTYHDHRAALTSRVFLHSALFVEGQVALQRKTEPLGTGISRLQGTIAMPDMYTQQFARLTAVLGTDTSRRYASVELSARHRNYDDEHAYSNLFDIHQQRLAVEFGIRRSVLFSYVTSVEASKLNYQTPEREDSNIYRGLVGIDWRPTGKSNLQLLVGAFWQDFTLSDPVSGLSWKLNYIGQPREDLRIEVKSARRADSSVSVTTSQSVREDFTVDAHYAYSDQWYFGVSADFIRTQLEEPLGSRKLEERMLTLATTLNLSRFQRLTLTASNRDVDSNLAFFNYQQNELQLTWLYEF